MGEVASSVSKIIFLDTNVYLHYRLFDQIDWPDVLKVSGVTIVVPPVTVRELNKLKELHPRARVKERAGTVLKKLFLLFKSGSQTHLRDSVEMWFEDRDPMIDFMAYQLNRNVQDDNLIASIVMLKNENPEAEVLLVTSDTGLTLMAKAKRLGIPTATLQDDLKLAEEPDPHQLRIRELEQKVRELGLKAPQLSLVFEDGSQYATFVLPHPFELTQEELATKQKQLEQQYPKMEHQTSQTSRLPDPLASIAEALASLNAPLGNAVSTKDIERYNAELDIFYSAYAEYLQKEIWYQNLKRRTVQLSIFIANDGTAPAEDVDVFMHFPDGFELTDEQGFPNPPSPPEPPAKPRTQMQQLLEPMSGLLVNVLPLASYVPHPVLPPPNVSTPNIRQTSSYDVDFHVQRIKHKLQESAEPMYIVFESFESTRSFQIDYRILAANVPSETTGKLHVIIDKNSGVTTTV